jgi:tetratricopeptide (TPR) repeat protein
VREREVSARLAVAAAVLLLSCAGARAHPGLHHDIARATEAIEKEPGRADLYVERARLERLDDQLEGALADLQQAERLDPGNARAAAEQGMTLSALRRDTEAERELSRGLAHGASGGALLAERARVRARLGRPREAVADYTAALDLQPEIDWYVERGALQERVGDLPAAAAGYREGCARAGGAVVLELALIRVETARGRYDAAREVVDRQLAQASVKTDWYLRRADLLEAGGQAQAARQDRERALEEANRALEANATGIHLLSRAKVQVALGKTQEARQDLELVLQKSPRFTEARELLDGLGAAAGKGMKP